jgi:prolycopene isomerase
MRYDVIVIGAGMGGLTAAASLAQQGKRVLLLEKNPHIGGTSYIFKRGAFAFPMGALGFGFPNKVAEFLEHMGISQKISFERNHFQLISPSLNIVYSASFKDLKEELKSEFPQEKKIELFFSQFEELIHFVKDAYPGSQHPQELERIQEYSRMSSGTFLRQYFKNDRLINLLGSMGTHPPKMSVLNLALMWDIMCFEGIWSPTCGIHGIADMIKEAFLEYGGILRTGKPVSRILTKNGAAWGVKCEDGEIHTAPWVVSNADYKKTFFGLVDRGDIPSAFLKDLEKAPYSQSELCVYLGIDPRGVDFSAMRASHLFYRHVYDPRRKQDLQDFTNREMEICRWSEKIPDQTPAGKASLVLRIGFPYDHFASYRSGEKQRQEGYRSYKDKLAWSLVRTVENILPGLSSSVEMMEAATPLTYRDWGQRHQGSITGWAWGARNEWTHGGQMLLASPISNLLLAGMYASPVLFLGGIGTAMYTGRRAADIILGKGTDLPD